MSAPKLHTEESMLALLSNRYTREQGNGSSGNGAVWAFIPKVRDGSGFAANRTMDALAMSLWPSRGLELHGHEIKCSRTDWLRELKDPAKSDGFMGLVDRWWLVVSEADIVRPGELPPTWGLMVVERGRLVAKTAPPLLRKRDEFTMPRAFVAALLRAACRTHGVTPAEVRDAVTEAQERWKVSDRNEAKRARLRADELEALMHEFETTSGLTLRGYRGMPEAKKIGATVRAVLDGDVQLERFEARVKTLLRMAEALAADLRNATGD